MGLHVEIDVVVNGKTFADVNAAADELNRSLTKGLDDGMRVVSAELMRTLRRVSSELQARHSNPWNGEVINPSPDLQSRSGGYLRAIAESVRSLSESGQIVAGQISTGDLSIHETGGTVRAKRAKFLTIPLPAAMDARGVALRSRARDWDNTFVAKSSNGNLIIFRRTGNDIVPLYVLKSSVYIRPRLGMERTLEAQMGTFEARSVMAIANSI